MERRLKERLVGATILVGLIVLIVPEFLSGPKPVEAPLATRVAPAESMRNVTVDLWTAKANGADEATASATAAASAAAPRTEAPHHEGSSPTATPPTATPPAATPPAAMQPPVVPALEKPASSPKSAAGAAPSWAVQLGSFATRAYAEQLLQRLKVDHYSVYVSSSGSGAALRYQVRVGPLADRPAAMRMLTKIRQEGHSATLVAP